MPDEAPERGCWYPVAGVDRLCRHATDGASSGLCPTHQRVLLHRRVTHFVDLSF
jgi:hypothetical protein